MEDSREPKLEFEFMLCDYCYHRVPSNLCSSTAAVEGDLPEIICDSCRDLQKNLDNRFMVLSRHHFFEDPTMTDQTAVDLPARIGDPPDGIVRIGTWELNRSSIDAVSFDNTNLTSLIITVVLKSGRFLTGEGSYMTYLEIRDCLKTQDNEF